MNASVRQALLIPGTLYLLLVPAVAQVGRASGSRTSIRGLVRDAVTHHTLERVLVTVDSESSGTAGQVETDDSGKFFLQGLMPDSYIVSIKSVGYYETTQRVDLRTVPLSYLSVELRPRAGNSPPPLAPEGPSAKLDSRLASVPDKARKEFTKARELWQQGKDPQECADHLNKAVKAYPRFPDAYVMLATVSLQQGKPAEARAALDHAIEIDPKLPEAWFTLGTLQNRAKDFAGAENSLTQGLQLDPESAQGEYELARTYMATGRWQCAEPHAKKAATLQPSLAPVHVLLGNIALKKQDATGALAHFQEYLKLDPKGPMAEGVEGMIKKIQDALNPPH